MWNARTGKRVFEDQLTGIREIGFSRDGAWAVAFGPKTKLLVVDLATETISASFQRPVGDLSSVVIAPKGNLMAPISVNGDVQLWNRDTGKVLASPLVKGDGATYNHVIFSPDAQRIAVASVDLNTNKARSTVWSITDDHPTGRSAEIGLDLPPLSQFDLEFSPDGNTVTTLTTYSATVWNAVSGARIGELVLPDGASAQLLDDARIIVSKGEGDHTTLAVFDPPSDKPLAQRVIPGEVISAGVAGDFTRFVSAGKSRSARVYKATEEAMKLDHLSAKDLFAMACDASINMVPGGAGDVICSRHPGKKVPCTINICPPVGPELVAVSTLNPVIFPNQTDKLGLAGAIQGFPVDVVKAKTIDAYAMANAEWVLEGYVHEGERMWETLEAEQSSRQGVSLLHPEWTRTMGHAYRTPRSFELTAVTRRKNDMIVYTPHFGSYWFTAPFICAAVYELCERMAPGFVKDVANWLGLTFWGGVVVQVKKRRRSDEGLQRNLMTAIMGLNRGMRMVIMVDDDIDPWQPEDVMWAIQSRASATKDYIVYNEYSRGQAFQPSEHKIGNISVADGGIGIDATAPLGVQVYERSRYPVDQMDFSKWFTQQEIAELKGMQDPYYGWLGETGYG